MIATELPSGENAPDLWWVHCQNHDCDLQIRAWGNPGSDPFFLWRLQSHPEATFCPLHPDLPVLATPYEGYNNRELVWETYFLTHGTGTSHQGLHAAWPPSP